MADIKVKKVDSGGKRLSNRELYAMLAYYYPQYTLRDAQELSARDLNLLLQTAKKQHALKMKDLVLIVAAPHAKDKDSVKKLAKHFEDLAKD